MSSNTVKCFESTLQYCLTFTHSCTHSHTAGGVNHTRRQPARREQLGLGFCLLREEGRGDGGAGEVRFLFVKGRGKRG